MTITVNRLITTNTKPTITGTITEFQRIDPTTLDAQQKLSVKINYKSYNLFQGNLGLDETVTPNVWKLQLDEDLFPGLYSVEVTVIDVATAQVLQNKIEPDIIQIQQQTAQQIAAQNISIPQQTAKIQALMGLVNQLFGGSNGVGGNPAIHPTTHDDSSTSLAARGGKERKKDPRVISAKKRAKKEKTPTTRKKDQMKSVSPEPKEPSDDDMMNYYGLEPERKESVMDKVKEASDTQLMDYYGTSQ